MKLWIKSLIPILISVLISLGLCKLVEILFNLVYNNLGAEAVEFVFVVITVLILTTISWAYRKSKGEK